jgi:NAD-dependent SIR2 family protein deacetylase
MPRFEFKCDTCEWEFTKETKRVEDPCPVPSCPKCGAEPRFLKVKFDVPRPGLVTLTLELRPGVVPTAAWLLDWLPLDEAPDD